MFHNIFSSKPDPDQCWENSSDDSELDEAKDDEDIKSELVSDNQKVFRCWGHTQEKYIYT